MSKTNHLKDLIAKEEHSITNLSAQLQRIQDQLDYHKDKLKYQQEQLELCLSR